jgi:hypothetical protein
MEVELPILAKLRKERLLPRAKKSMQDTDAAIVWPKIDAVEPQRSIERSDKPDPR